MENFIFGAVNPIYLIVNSKYYDSKYNGYDSSLAAINCGIPQGYVLGPLLFSLYIKDLNQTIKFLKVHHFADDNSLLYLGTSIKERNKKVNAELNI